MCIKDYGTASGKKKKIDNESSLSFVYDGVILFNLHMHAHLSIFCTLFSIELLLLNFKLLFADGMNPF